MSSLEKALSAMRANQSAVSFSDCLKVCSHYFGEPRIRGSHYVFKMPWKGQPWINIQNKSGNTKPYQVKQVLRAIDKLESENNV